MEDGIHITEGGEHGQAWTSPPPPPEPNALTADVPTIAPVEPAYNERSDAPLLLTSEVWDINSVSSLGALRMLAEALMTLADLTGDVPPTPPASRPTTPKATSSASLPAHSCPSSPPEGINIGSPELHPREPIRTIGVSLAEPYIRHSTIARRFFSRVAPPFSLHDYLARFHQWCPHAPGIYLAAAAYCYRLCVTDYLVPATSRTIHRLALASIRVATKALEDNKWSQERIAKVGGISKGQLLNLEVALCFLLDFELSMDEKILQKNVYLLQQAARQGMNARVKLAEGFKLRLPSQKKSLEVSAEA